MYILIFFYYKYVLYFIYYIFLCFILRHDILEYETTTSVSENNPNNYSLYLIINSSYQSFKSLSNSQILATHISAIVILLMI